MRRRLSITAVRQHAQTHEHSIKETAIQIFVVIALVSSVEADRRQNLFEASSQLGARIENAHNLLPMAHACHRLLRCADIDKRSHIHDLDFQF